MEPIHISHMPAYQLRHQSQDPALETIFRGLYITRLAWGLGLMNRFVGMRRLRGNQQLRVTVFQAMRMI